MLKTATLTKLAEALSKLELIQEIDQLRAEVDSHRPISKEIQDRIFQKFRLDWNYNSNAIEGNKLTYGETVALLMHGVTAKGKPLKDHMDVKGHNEGINLLLDIVKSERDFTQNDIRSLHEIILVEAYSSKTITSEGIPATKKINIGQYKTVPNHVKTPTGEMHYYASPAETPALMDDLLDWYETSKKNDKVHPFITASLFHHRFVSIHPFDDGNGRMTRLLMNLILMRNQYPLIVVPMKLREEYYGVLSQADVNEFEPLVEYFGNLLKHSLKIQLKGIKGENISEPDDIDKEIKLFKKSLDKNLIHKSKNNEIINSVIENSITPLLVNLEEKIKQFDDLFIDTSLRIKTRLSVSSTNLGYWLYLGQFLSELEANITTNIINPENINSFNLRLELDSFKNTENTFSISKEVLIEFKDLQYHISTYKPTETKFEVLKKYSETLSIEEVSNIVSLIIKDVIGEIKKNLNNR